MQAGPSATVDDARLAFVSHSTKDREVAEWVCSELEAHGISVWIAPRDVRPGRNYAEEIIHAIEATRLTIVVLSDNANASVHVQHEVERAVSKGKPVFPVRVADVAPARARAVRLGRAMDRSVRAGTNPESTA
jgi:TIR domain